MRGSAQERCSELICLSRLGKAGEGKHQECACRVIVVVGLHAGTVMSGHRFPEICCECSRFFVLSSDENTSTKKSMARFTLVKVSFRILKIIHSGKVRS